MPRQTRSQRWRRLEAFAQQRREHDARRLAAEMQRLWQQFEVTPDADHESAYRDPRLVATATRPMADVP